MQRGGKRKTRGQAIRVLIDSGSEKSCINTTKAKGWTTPVSTTSTRIVFADGSSRSQVKTCKASIKLDGYSFKQDCLVVETPAEFEMILSLAW